MAREFGMNTEVGQLFIDERGAREGPLAEAVARSVGRVIQAELERARQMLSENREALDRLVAELLERDRLTRPELERILAGVESHTPADGR
jgi:ATP-dependent Zn protease